MEMLDNEKIMKFWWGRIRWFMIVILFAIGILQIQKSPQSYPVVIFIAVFAGTMILNILFHLNVIRISNLIAAIQIILDIVFSTMVVHLTGGIESSFVWIYLLGVITASLSIEKTGGFIASMISSLSLLGLILLYNYGWLIPLSDSEHIVDFPLQTIFLISYTGLMTAVAFMANYFSDLVKNLNSNEMKNQEKISKLKEEKSKLEEQKIKNDKKLKDNVQLLKAATSVAVIDHELNNHLTIISLAVRRIKKAGMEYKDDKLIKYGNQMTDALNKIEVVLESVQKLKQLKVIKEARKKEQGLSDEEAYFNS